LTPLTDAVSIDKNVSNTTTRNYQLTNNGTAALGAFTCTSDAAWVTHSSGCPASLAVNATAAVTFQFDATTQGNGSSVVTLSFAEASAGSKSSVVNVTITNA
jgi:hypothetical protein